MSEQNLKWYEISIGWNKGKSWFLVDRINYVFGAAERQGFVEVKTVEGDISEITIQAKFSEMPTLAEAIRYARLNTGTDYSTAVYTALVGLDVGKRL